MPFNPETHVYTVRSCTFELAGSTYAVSRMELIAAESGIPTAVLTINPKPNAVASEVETLRLADLLGYISVIQGYANNPEGICALDMLMESDSDNYIVNISKWLLVDAGLSSSAKGELGCRITMQHPIQASSNSTITLLNKYKAAMNSGGDIGGSESLPTYIVMALIRYLDQHDPNATGKAVGGVSADMVTTIESIDKYTLGKARASVDVLDKYLKWDYPVKTPFSFTKFGDLFAGLAVTPDNYIQEGLSPYHTMMTMLDELMVMTRGTFSDEPLKAAPREPWGQATLSFAESEIMAVNLPQIPVNLISGVAVVGAADTSGYSSNTDGATNADKTLDSNSAVRGGYIDKADNINGKLYIVNPPPFFTYFGQMDNGTLTLNSRGLANNDNADTNGGSDPAIDISKLEFKESLRSAADAWAHDYFWKIYRSNFAVTFRAKFMLDKDGVPVQPGRVCNIVTDDGQIMYSCYIINVAHILDVPGKEAYTDITGYYARGATGIKGVLEPGALETSWIFGNTAPAK